MDEFYLIYVFLWLVFLIVSSSTPVTTITIPNTKTYPPTSPSPPAGPCLVVQGPGTGKACVFPFLWQYDNVLYDGCAFEKSRDPAPWCSTKVRRWSPSDLICTVPLDSGGGPPGWAGRVGILQWGVSGQSGSGHSRPHHTTPHHRSWAGGGLWSVSRPPGSLLTESSSACGRVQRTTKIINGQAAEVR